MPTRTAAELGAVALLVQDLLEYGVGLRRKRRRCLRVYRRCPSDEHGGLSQWLI